MAKKEIGNTEHIGLEESISDGDMLVGFDAETSSVKHFSGAGIKAQLKGEKGSSLEARGNYTATDSYKGLDLVQHNNYTWLYVGKTESVGSEPTGESELWVNIGLGFQGPYDIWLALGNTGTKADFLRAIKGDVVIETVNQVLDYALVLVDEAGKLGLALTKDGKLIVDEIKTKFVKADSLNLESVKLNSNSENAALEIADDNGNPVLVISEDGRKVFVDELLCNKLTTDLVVSNTSPITYYGPVVRDVDDADYLLSLANGQSLSRATAGIENLSSDEYDNIYGFRADDDRVLTELRTPTSFGINTSQNQGAPGPAKALANFADTTQSGGLIFSSALQLSHLCKNDPLFKQIPKIITASCGTNGTPIELLDKGDSQRDAYVDGQYQVSEAVRLAHEAGETLQIPWSVYASGESDGGAATDPTLLKSLLGQLIVDQRQDWINGEASVTVDSPDPRVSSTNTVPDTARNYDFKGNKQSDNKFPLIIYQPSSDSSPTTYSDGCSFVSFQYYELARDNTDIHIFAPYYQFPGRDHVHLAIPGYTHAGAQLGKVQYRILRGEKWEALTPRSVEAQSDTVILVRFNVPYGELVLDTTHILCEQSGVGVDPYKNTSGVNGALSMGFEVWDNTYGGYIPFAETPTIVGSKKDTLKIVLSSPLQDIAPKLLAGGPGLFPNGHKNGAGTTVSTTNDLDITDYSESASGYASPPIDNGPRINLRDSDITQALIEHKHPSGAKKPLYNWCVHFAETIKR